MGLRSFLVLHRRMGLISALFVLVLAITGLVLHYSNVMGLDRSYVSSPALLTWYGIEAPETGAAFEAGSSIVVQIGQSLYLDGRLLSGAYSPLVGMVAAPFGFVIATRGELLLLTNRGEIIEEFGAQHGLPLPLSKLAVSDGLFWLQSDGFVYQADFDRLEFVPVESAPRSWSETTQVPERLAADLTQQYTASLLSWERLILDLHSGQLFGAFGRILVDIMALLFILMAVTGVWIWSKRRP